MAHGGRRPDVNTFIWPDGVLDFEALFRHQIILYVGGSSGRRIVATVVARRLLGPLRVASVEDALGCLIPPALHQRGDGCKPSGGLDARLEHVGVHIYVGSWRVDVSEEQRILDGSFSVGIAEFFLRVFRRCCVVFTLPVILASVALGCAVGASDDAVAVVRRV